MPWSSGYGRRLMFQWLWVWIPAPYSGWTFFTFICCKNCNDVCLKRPKINIKEAMVGPFKIELGTKLVTFAGAMVVAQLVETSMMETRAVASNTAVRTPTSAMLKRQNSQKWKIGLRIASLFYDLCHRNLIKVITNFLLIIQQNYCSWER